MFRSIFSKLIVIFISILLIGFTITGIMLYYLLSNFVTSDKVDTLSKSGDEIKSYIVNVYFQDQNNAIYVKHLKDILYSYSVNTKSFIWVVNKSGYIMAYEPTKPDTDAFMERLKDNNGNIHLPDEKQYKDVMNTDKTIIKTGGDFYGLFKDTGVSWLTVEKPLIYKGSVVGAVYLHTQIPEVNKLSKSVLKLFLASVGISVFISIIFIYLFSLRISKPLKEINNAARIIAGGKFQQRLNITSNDEIGELAESFNHMVAGLEKLEEMRRGFIANVSHELRTPMTSIRGFIGGILDGTIPDEKHEYYLGIVRDEINRLNRLVNDLLDLARIEAGEMNFKFIDFDINELIRRSIIKLEGQIVSKEINVEADFEEDETIVSADQDSIERVIINLLHNAIKFTPEEGKISISTSLKKDKVLITIEDNGIGIDKNEIGMIWDRFYKSDKSRSKDKTGTGLGLSIVKNIINEHGQNISVESDHGKGTKFIFTLPLAGK